MATFIGLSLLGCGISVDIGQPGPGNASSGTSGAAGGPSSCSPSDPCPAGTWCKYEDERCEQDPGATGICVSAECEGEVPYCGCDGNVYPSACAAHLAGTYVTDAALCSKGTFACGDKLCKEHVEYCHRLIPVEGDYVFECATISVTATACDGGIPGCECITGYAPEDQPASGQWCGEDAYGHVTLSTQGL